MGESQGQGSTIRAEVSREYAEVSRWLAFMISMLGGIVGAVILVLPLQTLLLSESTYPLLLVLIVGITEEAFKPIGLWMVARGRGHWLPSKRDYLVAGALAGVGFGFLENLLYYLRFGGGILLARTGIGLPLHAGMSAFVGVGIYFAAVKKGYLKFAWLLAFAATVHAIYDFVYLLGA